MSGAPAGSTLLVLALLVTVSALGAALFNRLVRARERTREAWSAIAVQLRRRAQLIPPLVETVRGYAAHEQRVFHAIAQARSALAEAHEPGAAATANDRVTRALGRLYAVAEAYPELRASEAFTRLQDELSDVEEKIAYARHFYNRNVEYFNARIQSVPDVVVATVMGLERFRFFAGGDPAPAAPSTGFRPAATAPGSEDASGEH